MVAYGQTGKSPDSSAPSPASDPWLRSVPRIDYRYPRFVILASITRDDGMAVVNGSRGDDEVRLGKRVSRFPALFHQKPPLEHNVFSDRKNPLVEHRSHDVREPIIQSDAPAGFGDKPNAQIEFQRTLPC